MGIGKVHPMDVEWKRGSHTPISVRETRKENSLIKTELYGANKKNVDDLLRYLKWDHLAIWSVVNFYPVAMHFFFTNTIGVRVVFILL